MSNSGIKQRTGGKMFSRRENRAAADGALLREAQKILPPELSSHPPQRNGESGRYIARSRTPGESENAFPAR